MTELNAWAAASRELVGLTSTLEILEYSSLQVGCFTSVLSPGFLYLNHKCYLSKTFWGSFSFSPWNIPFPLSVALWAVSKCIKDSPFASEVAALTSVLILWGALIPQTQKSLVYNQHYTVFGWRPLAWSRFFQVAKTTRLWQSPRKALQMLT